MMEPFSWNWEFDNLGDLLILVLSPMLEYLGQYMPGDVFPIYFEWEMFQRALIAALLISIVAGLFGTFLMLRNLAPVSYTHLRAHETDSYLVCRLLLEKKKR